MAARKKRLTKPEVLGLISQICDKGKITEEMLLTFAEKVNGGPFSVPKPKKPKAMTMAAAKKAVLSNFGCKTVTELRKNKNFSMSMTGETISLKSKDDWMKQYRRWVGVPKEERELTGPACVNGINVLEDENLRQGIKEFSDWPTIPQLYIKKEFVGGCDIIKELSLIHI